MKQSPLFYTLYEQAAPLRFAPPEIAETIGGTVLESVAITPDLSNGNDEPEQPPRTGFKETSKVARTQDNQGNEASDPTVDIEPEG